MIYTFRDEKAIESSRVHEDINTIMKAIDGCVGVTKTGSKEDKAGTDYIATLRGGAKILIDAKTRREGCAKHWNHGPELALEKWSDVEKRKVGWTLDESHTADYILFTFSEEDYAKSFLYPFQLLRIAFRRFISEWETIYRVDRQRNMNYSRWITECIFVPEVVVAKAVREVISI